MQKSVSFLLGGQLARGLTSIHSTASLLSAFPALTNALAFSIRSGRLRNSRRPSLADAEYHRSEHLRPSKSRMLEAVRQGFLLGYGGVGVGVGVTWTSNEPMSMRPFTTRW